MHSFVAVSLHKDSGIRSTPPLILVQLRVAQFSFIDFWGKFVFLQQKNAGDFIKNVSQFTKGRVKF